MTTHLITDNQAFVRLMLDHACPLTKDEAGVSLFYIETHCTAWHIEAHKPEGEWVVLSMRASAC